MIASSLSPILSSKFFIIGTILGSREASVLSSPSVPPIFPVVVYPNLPITIPIVCFVSFNISLPASKLYFDIVSTVSKNSSVNLVISSSVSLCRILSNKSGKILDLKISLKSPAVCAGDNGRAFVFQGISHAFTIVCGTFFPSLSTILIFLSLLVSFLSVACLFSSSASNSSFEEYLSLIKLVFSHFLASF